MIFLAHSLVLRALHAMSQVRLSECIADSYIELPMDKPSTRSPTCGILFLTQSHVDRTHILCHWSVQSRNLSRVFSVESTKMRDDRSKRLQ